MTAMKILPKTFSGGSLKLLPELMKGLAIDNARNAFAIMDLTKLTIDNQILGVLPFAMVPLAVPEKSGKDIEIPETFWNMALDATCTMQLLAKQINIVLERFGIPEIVNAGGPKVAINEIRMEFSDETVVVAGQNYGGQMKYLTDGLTCLSNRVSDILVALGGERLDGNCGGSPKCNQIYPVLENRDGNHSVGMEELGVFLNDFNMNLSFIVSEWNMLVGVGEPGMEFSTSVVFDEGVITIPVLEYMDPHSAQEVKSDDAWHTAASSYRDVLEIMEAWVEIIANKYAHPYETQIPMSSNMLTETLYALLEFEPSIRPAYEPGEVIAGDNVGGELLLVCQSLEAMLIPINHALAMTGNMTIIDLVTEQKPESAEYNLSCETLFKALGDLDKSVACLGTAIRLVTKIQVSSASKSLTVIAG